MRYVAVCAIGVTVLCSCPACGVGHAARPASAAAAQEQKTPQLRYDREIVCWGDSMTAGVGSGPALIVRGEEVFDASDMSYPEVLQVLTGIATYNFGVAGATSEEIAFMQGARVPDDPDDLDVLEEDVVDLGRCHLGDVVVLEIGSNGGWDDSYDELIAQYRDMIAHAGCDSYIVIGDTDDPGTSIADTSQEAFDEGEGLEETDWEAALREEFGEHFINMRLYLVEHGLEVAGLTATEADVEDASRGCVSEQLRADWTHLNSYGYYAQAVAVFERGQELGYW